MIGDKSNGCLPLLSEDYENNLAFCLPVPPEMEWSLFQAPQENDPGDNLISSGHSPVSSESISSFKSNIMLDQNKQDCSKNLHDQIFSEEEKVNYSSTNNTPPPPPPPEEEPNNEEESSQEPQEHQKGRDDDSNNIRKKIITSLHDTLQKFYPLKKKELKKLIKSLKQILRLTNEKLDSKKSARYGFVCELLNIKYLIGDELLEDLEPKFFQKLTGNEFSKNEKANEYLKNSIRYYQLSYKEVRRGDIQEGVKLLYSSDQFKKGVYLKRAIKYVKEYQNKLVQLLEKLEE